MPKMKSHRGAAKRFKITASGKVSRSRNNKQHILTKKASKRKRRLREETDVAPGDAARVKRLLGLR